jgi:hypothetical protein
MWGGRSTNLPEPNIQASTKAYKPLLLQGANFVGSINRSFSILSLWVKQCHIMSSRVPAKPIL